ncbi:MAG: hypothetical protein ACI841_002199 [Planctomycetota bacterium]|jgi:hypothetical protein
MTVKMAGEEIPAEFLPQLEILTNGLTEMEVIDTYVSVSNGRATRMTRSYESISANKTMEFEMTGMGDDQSEDGESDGSSKLEGRTVDFEWDQAAEAYELRFEGGEESVSPPASLVQDYDLRLLLPSDEVEVGDSWTVDIVALAGVMELAIDLDLEWEGDDLSQGEPTQKEEAGELELLFTKLETSEGVRLAHIEIVGEVTKTEVFDTDLERVPVADGEATETFVSDVDLSGTLIWNLDAGLMQSFELGGDGSLTSTIEKTDAGPGEEFESTSTFTFELSLEFTVSEAD